MNVEITITQATILYSILQSVPLKNEENAIRWAFLESMEPSIEEFEKAQDDLFKELKEHEVTDDKLSFMRARKVFNEMLEKLKMKMITVSLNQTILDIFCSVHTERLSPSESRTYAKLYPIFMSACK